MIIDVGYDEEPGGDWVDGDGWLTSIIPARADLAAGDLRALYLAWLVSVQQVELADDEVEPPVPPGLGELTASLSTLVDFLRIDEDLLAVAATASPPLEGESALAGVGVRAVGELLDAADVRRTDRERLAAERDVRERARREHEAAVARERRLESLARQEERAWQRVSALIDTKKQDEYDEAVALLVDLRAVGERTDGTAEFERRVRELRLVHRRKPSLIDRFDRAGLGH